MTDRARTAIFCTSAAVAAGILLFGVWGLPDFGTFAGAYASMLLRAGVLERHVLNIATAVNFDYRGFDTLGEEFILFTAVAGVLLIFSELRESSDVHPEPMSAPGDRGRTGSLRAFATGLAAFICAMGMNVAVHTAVTPGGGFQGGAIFAGAFVCIYLGSGYYALDRTANRSIVDTLECFGASAFAVVGIASAFAAGAFLKNAMALGQSGAIVSGGSIFLINACVFVEVACGFIFLLLVYLHQTCERQESPD